MLNNAKLVAFAATARPDEARRFYVEVLGLALTEEHPFALVFDANGTMLRLQKLEHWAPPGHTALGWQVDDIRGTIHKLAARGVHFERFGGLPQDDLGVWTTPDGTAIAWFKDPDRWDVFLASSGPEAWQRVAVDDPQPEVRPAEQIEVTNVEVGTDRISFDVDQPGTPVLVKTSYFPNWRASGADGPYRVAPNLMVVVPTGTQVELTYGREPVDWVAWLLTALGIALAVLLASRPPLTVTPRRSQAIDEPALPDDPP